MKKKTLADLANFADFLSLFICLIAKSAREIFYLKEFSFASKSSLLIIPTVSISLSPFLIKVKGIEPPSQVLVIVVK